MPPIYVSVLDLADVTYAPAALQSLQITEEGYYGALRSISNLKNLSFAFCIPGLNVLVFCCIISATSLFQAAELFLVCCQTNIFQGICIWYIVYVIFCGIYKPKAPLE